MRLSISGDRLPPLMNYNAGRSVRALPPPSARGDLEHPRKYARKIALICKSAFKRDVANRQFGALQHSFACFA
jgi:hypothetical protein